MNLPRLIRQNSGAFVVFPDKRPRAFRKLGKDNVKLLAQRILFRSDLSRAKDNFPVLKFLDDCTHDSAAKFNRVVQSGMTERYERYECDDDVFNILKRESARLSVFDEHTHRIAAKRV